MNVQNFSCPTCVAGLSVVADDSIAIADGTFLEVKQFFYLGDMSNRSRHAERTVRCRIAFGWDRWRELAIVLRNRGISLNQNVCGVPSFSCNIWFRNMATLEEI